MYLCTGCGRKYHNSLSECPACGGPLFSMSDDEDAGHSAGDESAKQAIVSEGVQNVDIEPEQRISQQRTERVRGEGGHWIGDHKRTDMSSRDRRESYRQRMRKRSSRKNAEGPPFDEDFEESMAGQNEPAVRFGATRSPEERGSKREKRKRQKKRNRSSRSRHSREVSSQRSQSRGLVSSMMPSSSSNSSNAAGGSWEDSRSNLHRLVIGVFVCFGIAAGFWFWVF